MTLLTIRERLISRILELTDEQAEDVLRYTNDIQPAELPADYDEDHDPSIGILTGPTDLASRAKQILRDEITPHSGWTQKKD